MNDILHARALQAMVIVFASLGCSSSVIVAPPADAAAESAADAPTGADITTADVTTVDVTTVDVSTADAATDAATDAAVVGDGGLARFSFFVTSLRALQDLSGSQQGFGGDLIGVDAHPEVNV